MSTTDGTPDVEETVETPDTQENETSQPQADTADEGDDESDVEGLDEGSDVEGELPQQGAKGQAGEQTRGQRRQQKLANELKAEREAKEKLIEERARAMAELDFLRNQRNHQNSDQERQDREARLSLMEPHEKMAFLAQERAAAVEARLVSMEREMQMERDRSDFIAKWSAHPEILKHAPAVDEIVKEQAARGITGNRDDYLFWKIGKEMAETLANAGAKKETAAKRVAQVTAKPLSGKSDVSSAKKSKSLEDRLSGVLI